MDCVFSPTATVCFLLLRLCAFSYRIATTWFAELGEIVDCATSLLAVGGRTCVLDSSIFLIREICATVWDDLSIRCSQ